MPKRDSKAAIPLPKDLPEDFPLTPHKASGKWRKLYKVEGEFTAAGRQKYKPRFYGRLTDWRGALEEFEALFPFHSRGLDGNRQVIFFDRNNATISTLGNVVLEEIDQLPKDKKLSDARVRDMKKIAKHIGEVLGKGTRIDSLTPDHFVELRRQFEKGKRGKDVKLSTLRSYVANAQRFFRFAEEKKLLPDGVTVSALWDDEEFELPPAAEVEKERNTGPSKCAEGHELVTILKSLNPLWRAMFLLACNAGLENEMVSQLRLSTLRRLLAGNDRMLEGYRHKTGMHRRAWLWPETVHAIKEYLKQRPKPQEGCEDVAFLMEHGGSWQSDVARDYHPHSYRFGELLMQMKIKRVGLTFYSGRHTLRSYADKSLAGVSQSTINAVMGHKDGSMSGKYNWKVPELKIVELCDALRDYLRPVLATLNTPDEEIEIYERQTENVRDQKQEISIAEPEEIA